MSNFPNIQKNLYIKSCCIRCFIRSLETKCIKQHINHGTGDPKANEVYSAWLEKYRQILEKEGSKINIEWKNF